MTDLRRIRYFAAVAEELHFGRSAVRLHVSQPPLSQQIRALETELGVRLFERDRRSVQLTPAGSAYLPHAHDVLRAADLAAQAAQRAASGESGELRIGYSYSALYAHAVLHAITGFRKRYPSVAIRLLEGTTRTHAEDIETGRIDTAFVRGPLPAHAERWPASRKVLVCRERLLVALPRHHRLSARQRIALKELSGQPLVTFARGMGTALATLVDGLLAALPDPPTIAVETRDMASLLGLVGAGAGVAVVPDSVAGLRSRYVVFRPLSDQAARMMLYQLHAATPVAAAVHMQALLQAAAAQAKKRA